MKHLQVQFQQESYAINMTAQCILSI